MRVTEVAAGLAATLAAFGSAANSWTTITDGDAGGSGAIAYVIEEKRYWLKSVDESGQEKIEAYYEDCRRYNSTKILPYLSDPIHYSWMPPDSVERLMIERICGKRLRYEFYAEPIN